MLYPFLVKQLIQCLEIRYYTGFKKLTKSNKWS